MATNFPQALGQQPRQYIDPEQAAYEAALAKLQKPLAPTFTPEQVAARRAQNDREYQLGLLGSLSSDEGLKNVGGQVFRQALAARAPRISERGSSDQVTGEFTYDPDYLRQREEATTGAMGSRIAGRVAAEREQRVRAEERLEAQRRHDDMLRATRGGNEPLVQVVDPDSGQAMYVRRSEAVGMRAPPRGGGGHATDGEKLSAGFAAIMQQATGNIENLESRGRQTTGTQVAAAIPMIGNTVASSMMTPAQQGYAQGAQQWVRAKLRRESGATIGEKEMADEIRTFFPQPEDGPVVREQKRQARLLANQAMVTAAGRAEIPALKPPAAEVDVGAMLGRAAPAAAAPQRNPMGAPRQVFPKSNPQPGGANRVIEASF